VRSSMDEGTEPRRQLSLRGRTVVMSGGSRGIGLAIGVAAARLGANVALLAKTDTPDPRLPGTVHSAVAEIEAAGGQAIGVVGDVREEKSVAEVVERAVERFGRIDVCVNNASALSLEGTEELPTKRFELMQQIQLRGTFLLTRACLPHLRRSDNPHVLSLAPPLNLSPAWLGKHPAYTVAKYGMTLLTLGWAAEQKAHGVAANCLWPESTIATAAVQNLLGGSDALSRSRNPEIVADAAIEILTRPSGTCTGNAFLDVEVLADAGVTDFERYGGGTRPHYDIFVDAPSAGTSQGAGLQC